MRSRAILSFLQFPCRYPLNQRRGCLHAAHRVQPSVALPSEFCFEADRRPAWRASSLWFKGYEKETEGSLCGAKQSTITVVRAALLLLKNKTAAMVTTNAHAGLRIDRFDPAVSAVVRVQCRSDSALGLAHARGQCVMIAQAARAGTAPRVPPAPSCTGAAPCPDASEETTCRGGTASGEMIVRDLHHQLGLERLPLRAALRAPPARPARRAAGEARRLDQSPRGAS